MATHVVASCSECSEDTSLPAENFTAYPGLRGEGIYTFPCPKCGEQSVKALTRDVARLFKMAPRVKWITPPLELAEHGDGPMLNSDDFLTFVIKLHNADTAEILARAVL